MTAAGRVPEAMPCVQSQRRWGGATWKPSQDPDATPRIESRGTRPPTPAVEAPGGAPLSWLEGRLSGQSSVCPALGVSKTPRRSGSSEEDAGLMSASFSSDLPHRYPRRAGAPRPTSATRSARPSVTWGRAPRGSFSASGAAVQTRQETAPYAGPFSQGRVAS